MMSPMWLLCAVGLAACHQVTAGPSTMLDSNSPLTCESVAMCTTYAAPGLDPSTITAPRGGALVDGIYQLRAGNARGPFGHDLAFVLQGSQVLSIGDPANALGTWSLVTEGAISVQVVACTSDHTAVQAQCDYAAQGNDLFVACEKWGGPTARYLRIADPADLCNDGFGCTAGGCTCNVALATITPPSC